MCLDLKTGGGRGGKEVAMLSLVLVYCSCHVFVYKSASGKKKEKKKEICALLRREECVNTTYSYKYGILRI